MPIPAPQVGVTEVHMLGLVASGGSTNKIADFVFHFRRTTTVNPIVKTAVETAFQAAIAVPVCAALNSRFVQTSSTVRWVNDALDPPFPVTRAIAGGVAGDGQAMHMAAYLLMRTGLRGRSYRGSKHFFPLSEADSTAPNSDIMNAASLVLWGAVAAALAAGFTDANANVWVPCILSRKLSKLVTNPTTVVTNDVTLVLINKRFGRMRRREVRSVY
jgi:hypothetical protein